MKLAVISDIHGNTPALEAVLEDIIRWQADRLIVNGDLVNRGPCSLASLQLLLRHFPQAHLLRGNHEDFVLSCASSGHDPEHPLFDLRRFAHWTYEQMGVETATMQNWENELDLDDLEGARIHITHASRVSNRHGISTRTSDAKLPGLLGDSPKDLFICSHTHKPLQRHFKGTEIINTGAVGAPFDEDHRASYARFIFLAGSWKSELVRVRYDYRQTEKDYYNSGFLEGGGPLARLMLEELRHARMFIGPWMHQYHAAIHSGALSIHKTVDEFLRNNPYRVG